MRERRCVMIEQRENFGDTCSRCVIYTWSDHRSIWKGSESGPERANTYKIDRDAMMRCGGRRNNTRMRIVCTPKRNETHVCESGNV